MRFFTDKIGDVSERNAWIESVALNTFFLLLCILFGRFVYGAIDDFFMAGILSGIYGGENNVHLTFVNVLYGYVLLPLYHVFPKIGWYFIGEIAAVFVSFAIICFVLIKKTNEIWGTILSILFVSAAGRDHYLVMQFTQCASILSAAGMLLFIYSLERKNKLLSPYFFLSVTLMLWGSIMRWDAFLMGWPLFILALLWVLKNNRKNAVSFIIGVFVVLVCALGAHEFDRLHYSDSDYSAYMDFQRKRAILGDGRVYKDQAVYEDLEEMEKSGADFGLLKAWVFYDKEVFAPDSLDIIMGLLQKYKYEYSYYHLFSDMLGGLFKFSKFPITWLWLFFGLLLYVSCRKNILYLWINLIFVLMLMAYLQIIGRPVYRVENGFWVYASVMLIPMINIIPTIQKKYLFGLIVLLIGLNIFVYSYLGEVVKQPNTGDYAEMANKNSKEDIQGLWNYIKDFPDSNVFLVDHNTYMMFAQQLNPPFLAEPKNSWNKIIPMGYWTPYFPDVELQFRQRGIVNPMKDVVQNNVLVVGDVNLKSFLKRHYYDEVSFEKIKDFNGIAVLKYYSSDGDKIK
jgi:hypothetical protein